MKNCKFKLKEYSLLAVSVLSLKEGITEVIYTDIDPDIEIQYDSETAFVDMDNNGTFDFAFLKTSDAYYYYWTLVTSTGIYRFRHGIWAGPEFSYNEIAARSVTHGSYGGATTYFPYTIANGNLINNELSFQNAGFQLMGSGFYQTNIGPEYWNNNKGSWNPDVDSSYLGVRFKGNDECMHYGWIRCTTTDSTKRLIIHDYAYETECGHPIVAGSLESYVNIEGEANTLDANVYSFNNSVYINLPVQINYDVEIHIYDLNGKEIYFTSTENLFYKIELDEPAGIYLVEVISNPNDAGDKKKLCKKVFLD